MGWIIVGLLAVVVLIVIVSALIGMQASRKESKAAASANSQAAVSTEPDRLLEPVATSTSVIPAADFSSYPEADGGISQEIVAVIAAAIAAMAPEGTRYAIRRVSRIPRTATGRSAWSMAGLLQNTKPF